MTAGELPTIAVLGGSGAEGGGIALRLAHAGYPVIIGSRSPERAAAAAEALNAELDAPRLAHDGNLGAAAAADIVVLTVPYAAQLATATEVAVALDGKILVDATVPLVPPRASCVQLPEGGSAVAAVAVALGPSVRVVSAFQNVSAHLLRKLDAEVDCDVLVCGDDADARETVVGLAKAMGLRAWHAGPIANSAVAEALTSALIAINKRYKTRAAGIRITGVGGPS